MLELYDSTGNVIAANDNWRETQKHDFIETGRFQALQPASGLESALAISLPPGAYVLAISGKNSTTGIGLAEVYAESPGAGRGFSYVSARGVLSSSVLISGITVSGDANTNYIVRALGPSLTESGITNALADPVLEIYDGNGGLIASNDDWVADADQARQIMAAGFAPKDPLESAISLRLAPGTYTVVTRGKNDATGTAFIDISSTP